MDNIQHDGFVVKYVEVLPETAPCPDCGQPARRNSVGERTVQEPSLDQPTFLIIRMSVCRCDNPTCGRKYFRVPLPFVLPRARYTEQAKQVCVASITRDGMPFRRVPERVAEDFHLYPVLSTVWEWHRDRCDGLDLSTDYEPWVRARFSGVLCIDEVYDGPLCLILSTDPLNDLTVVYTLETKEEGTKRPMLNQAWLDRHVAALQRMGITPQVIIRDGAVIYDAGLPPDWAQERCNFHLLQDITTEVLKAVNAYRKTLPDPPNRPTGRPTAEAPAPLPKVKTEIWHHRYLWVSRPETIARREHHCHDDTHRCVQRAEATILQDLCAEHPPLATVRQFMLDIWGLFDDPDARVDIVNARYDHLCEQLAYRENPHLWKALAQLSGATLEQACRFLDYTNLPKTNNHVEGKARSFRKRQKSHDKLRRTETIDRAMKAELLRQQARKQARQEPIVRLQWKDHAHLQTPPAQAA